MNTMVQSNSDVTRRWVTFKLGNESYGIDVMQVQEVLRVTEIAPVPGAPHYVLGIINLRGNVVTVIDTRVRLGLGPRGIDEASRVVIIEVNKNILGVLVDSVAEVIDISNSQIESAPNVGNDESSKYLQGVVSLEGELLILMDLHKLLSDDEWMEAAGI